MSTNSEPVLLVEVSGGLATLTMNRPQAMNALSSELRVALSKAIDALSADPAVRVMILTGAGRAFSAGLDLKELGSGESQIGGVLDGGNVVRALARFQGPIIGAINGAAITGGFELALACDVLIASSTARFADTHVRVGVMPGWGLSSETVPRHWHFARQGTVADGQFPVCGTGRQLGAGQPCGGAGGIAARRARPGAGHVVCHSRKPDRLQETD